MIISQIKSMARAYIRKKLKLKNNQGIVQGLTYRYIIPIKRKLYTQQYNATDLVKTLAELGIHNGDTLTIHSSWNEFFNYNDSAVNLIEQLMDMVGDQGAIFMPCFGTKPDFNVLNTPSSAGYLTEIFRRKDGVIRSECSHFAMSGAGPMANEVLKDHVLSQYGFDAHSPYYKLSQVKDSKVLLLGLGKRSSVISVLHCVGWLLKGKLPYFDLLLSNHALATVTGLDGNTVTRNMIERNGGTLNKRVVKSVYKHLPSDSWGYGKISNLDIVWFNTHDMLELGIDMAKRGKVIYKTPKPKKNLFVPYEVK